MKKASIGIAAILAVLFVLAIAISLNITGGTRLVKADPEECNGLDDDGDTLIDEDFTYNGLPIGDACTGIGACSSSWGEVVCRDLNTADCSVNIEWHDDYAGSSETCNSIDDDCDGLIDEGFTYNGDPVGELCFGIGECSDDAGEVYCKDTATADCSTNSGGPDYAGSPETCNELDDDCDTEVDEDGVCTISITLYDYPINFGSLNPGTTDNAGTGNPYTISIDPVTGPNVDLYHNGTDFTDGGNVLGIENMTWSTTDNAGASLPFNETYDSNYPIATNVPSDTNITMYYWLDVPGGKTAGGYTATINIKAVQTGTSP